MHGAMIRAIKDIETRRQKIHAADPSYKFAVFSATRILFLPKLTQFIAENLPNSKTNLNSPCSRSFWLKLFPSLCSGDKIYAEQITGKMTKCQFSATALAQTSSRMLDLVSDGTFSNQFV